MPVFFRRIGGLIAFVVAALVVISYICCQCCCHNECHQASGEMSSGEGWLQQHPHEWEGDMLDLMME